MKTALLVFAVIAIVSAGKYINLFIIILVNDSRISTLDLLRS